MGEARSLQDMIVENAGALFREQGYAATSIRQIAQPSDCTEAALRPAKDAESLVHLPQADSLEEFLGDLAANLAQRFFQSGQ